MELIDERMSKARAKVIDSIGFNNVASWNGARGRAPVPFLSPENDARADRSLNALFCCE